MMAPGSRDKAHNGLLRENIRLESRAGFAEDYFANLARRERLEPETALLLAVLEDAIACYQKYSSAHDKRFCEAERWIMEEKDNRLFSFVSICQVLGLEPQYVRQGLKEWGKLALQQEGMRSRSALRRRAA